MTMRSPLVHPAKPRPGDKVAVLSPSFAAPAVAPAVHEQALRRLAEVTGLVPVEFPTTRKVGASPRERAAQRDAVLEEASAYNPEAVVCVGPPFGHTRPQWILPYGGEVTLDGVNRRVTASYV
ncbi:MAG: hypothetical protein IT345_10040 [Trueperaceae bacterium]|nr:hypothetical protein [Trueperaceae bacterium]